MEESSQQVDLAASMKCSSRRNCNRPAMMPRVPMFRLNEVQFPKELQHDRQVGHGGGDLASMKCSSRRNCNMIDR